MVLGGLESTVKSTGLGSGVRIVKSDLGDVVGRSKRGKEDSGERSR